MEPLRLAFFWHQHQPDYRDPNKGIFVLPWVRFHGIKDYFDMVAVLDDFPEIHQNINLVPSLLSQLDDYVKGRFEDRVEILTRIPAERLERTDKVDILKYFFQANWQRQVGIYPGYVRLLEKRGLQFETSEPDIALRRFSNQDFLDLQVWYNLSWTGESHKRVEPFKSLLAKDHDFTESDKLRMLEAQKEILTKIVEKHNELQQAGRIELSSSPFYHPILPLLCDSNIAKECQPGVVLPNSRFRRPEDARLQITRAIDFHKNLFDVHPKGMWPSEGSVSSEVAEIMAENNIQWIATDEEVLFASLNQSKDYIYSREDLYQAWPVQTKSGAVNIFFRDHELSDLVGFVYQSWDPEKAAKDFIARLKRIRHSIVHRRGEKHLKHAIVSVILDGENCWEFYADNGRPFLEALYSGISSDSELKSVTYSEHLADSKPPGKLKSLFPGSWINRNFAIWIGHPEDNKAWDYLNQARKALEKAGKSGQYDQELLEAAMEEILVAEGSDWCWWYGDDHATANADEFDELFRSHLMRVYELLELDIPVEFFNPISQKGDHNLIISNPRGFISPKIDGTETNYFEWLGAGVFETQHQGESMHRMAQLTESIVFGFDLKNFYLKIRIANIDSFFNSDSHAIEVDVVEPKRKKILIKTDLSHGLSNISVNGNGKKSNSAGGIQAAAGNCFEIKIPFSLVDGKPDDPIAFQISILENDEIIEKWPRNDLIRFRVPGPNFEKIDWSA